MVLPWNHFQKYHTKTSKKHGVTMVTLEFFCYPYKKYWGGVLCTICTIYVRVAALN